MKKHKVDVFASDFYRMTGTRLRPSLNTFKRMLFQHNLRYMYWWRKASTGSFLGKVHTHLYSRKYGIEISTFASLGEGIYLGHPYNITVNSGVQTGKNINLHKGCTIGADIRGPRKGCPILGNNVWIGINATVIGNIKIGDDVLIAPNAFVNFDVPSHSIVLGNPGVIHHKNDATKGYVNYAD